MNNENELDTTKEEKALNWILIVMVIVQILTGIAFLERVRVSEQKSH